MYAPAAGVPAGANYAVAQSDRVRRNIGLLAALWMVNGVLRLLETSAFAVIGPAFLSGLFGWHHWRAWDGPFGWAPWPFSFGLAWLGILFGAFGIIHLVLAWGLQERKPWARSLGVAVGFLALLRFPLGTALGLYTLWVLLPEPSAREYNRMAVA